MPPSSADALLEQLRELLEDRREELRDGLSVRALARRLEEHQRGSLAAHDQLEQRIREVEAEVRERKAVSDFRLETGRYHIVPPAPPVAIPIPPAAPKKSIGPVMRAVLKSPAFHWLGVVVIVLASHLLARCGIQAPSPLPPAASVSH